jgi:hypothetical protein
MKAWPKSWRVHHGRDPEREVLRLKRGFRQYRAVPTAREGSAASTAGPVVGAAGCKRRPRRLPRPCAVAVAADHYDQAHLVVPKLRGGACRWSGTSEKGSARLLAGPRCGPRRHRLRAVGG